MLQEERHCPDRSEGEKLVVFADLDLTLFDQTRASSRAYSHSISALDLRISRKEAHAVRRLIVKHWEVFQLMGFPNFRIIWNSPRLYEVLVALVRIGKNDRYAFKRKLKEVDDKLASLRVSGRNKSEIQILRKAEIAAFEGESETRVFRRTLRSIEKNHSLQKRIQRALDMFELSTKRLPPFEDALELAKEMDRLGIDLYIVSEGDTSVQLDKIKKLGLGKLINKHRVFVVREKTEDSFLKVIRSIRVEQGVSLKLAVVGDRYDKDLAPLIRLFGDNVMTIRLLYGKYKDEYSNDALEEMGLPKPSATVRSIGQAKRLLMKRSTWERIKEITVGG